MNKKLDLKIKVDEKNLTNTFGKFVIQPMDRGRLYATLKGLLEDGIKQKEFPQLDSSLMFKAIGGLFTGMIFLGDKNDPVSEKDVEALLNKLITIP